MSPFLVVKTQRKPSVPIPVTFKAHCDYSFYYQIILTANNLISLVELP